MAVCGIRKSRPEESRRTRSVLVSRIGVPVITCPFWVATVNRGRYFTTRAASVARANRQGSSAATDGNSGDGRGGPTKVGDGSGISSTVPQSRKLPGGTGVGLGFHGGPKASTAGY